MNNTVDWILIKEKTRNQYLACEHIYQIIELLEAGGITPPNRVVMGVNSNYWFEWYFENLDVYASVVVGENIEYFFTDGENDAIYKTVSIDELLAMLPKCMYARYD